MTTDYVLDLNTGLTQVLEDGTNTYLYGNGRIGELQPSGFAYHLGDALGSVRQLTNEAGEVMLARSFEPYGNELTSAGNFSTVMSFTGEVLDSYIKLLWLRSRWLSPDLGRFTSKDTFRDYSRPLSLNGWAYVESNPINLIDPSGFSSCQSQTCRIMRDQYKSYIVSAAARFNLPVFTNMTDNGFAALLGATLLFENRITRGETVPGGQRNCDAYLGELTADRLGAISSQFEFNNRATDLANGRPKELSGVSYGVANVYITQSINAQLWWHQLANHVGQYPGTDRYQSYDTEFLRNAGELTGVWDQVAYGDAVAYVNEVGALLSDELNIERQALIMIRASFLNYEGAAGAPAKLNDLCWGQNAGLVSDQISAFRIALVVRGGYNQLDPGAWAPGPGTQGQPIPDSLKWVSLIPTAASMLDLSVTEGNDYHSLTARDALTLDGLGYTDSLVRRFLPN